VLADLEEHLGDSDLSPSSTARRLGISVRQLHALFAEHDRSFAAEVRRRRLELARRDLMDPARSHLRVIDISVEAGFVNVASFHRAFRRQFGQTPAQIRAAALGPQ
jgi:AraC-like DNA-binding protein